MWSLFRGLPYKGSLSFVCLLFIGWLLAAGSVFAATVVNISGTIRAAPSCVLNGDYIISVLIGGATGRIDVANIDGKNYKAQVPFSISCKNILGNTVKLQIQGNESDFYPGALQTNIPGLGLALSVDGSPISVNQWFNVNYLSLPAVEVVPVKALNASLPSKFFLVRAVLVVGYM